jgi:AraC-like DNA-binding protein
MPLYMDLHKIPKITIAEAKKAHVADEQIQQKYGVKYLQFWCNEQSGTLFCLVEGPDKDTVESVHRMAHGHVACAVVEVDPSYYATIMGDNVRIDQGLVHNHSGEVDLGYRSIMVVAVKGKGKRTGDDEQSKSIAKARLLVHGQVSKYGGRSLPLTGDDRLAAAFDSAAQAWQCAASIQKEMNAWNKKEGRSAAVQFQIGLSAGQPVTESDGFIGETLRLAKNLCQFSSQNSVMTSALFAELCGEELGGSKSKVRTLSGAEESFLVEVSAIIDKRLFDDDLNIESLVREAGISRPQLYRKIHKLTGLSPNDLIRDLRLEKALYLLKRKSGNVSEIAFQVGFSNPSYFAKCFTKKFGSLPSEILVR